MNRMIANLTIAQIENPEIIDILNFLKTQVILLEITKDSISKRNEEPFQYYLRKTIAEKQGTNQGQIKQQLEQYRRKVDFIVVEPKSAQVASLAARDKRVDAIRLGHDATVKLFNTRYGRRLEEHSKFIELDLGYFFSPTRAKDLRRIIKILQALSRCKVQYILTIGGYDKPMLRSYRGLQSIARILELDNAKTKVAAIIERLQTNRKKCEGLIPIDGVELD